jgi:uncharacterized protein YjbJ (UPF0337 family)
VTDNPRFTAAGKGDQAEAHARNAGERVKDAAREAKNAFKK